jgi:hypothetical protein
MPFSDMKWQFVLTVFVRKAIHIAFLLLAKHPSFYGISFNYSSSEKRN